MERWRKNLYITWFTQILSLSGFGFMLPFIPYFFQEVGVTGADEVSRWVGLAASLPALTMGAMAPVWGYLADRIGRKIMILRSMLAGSLILLGMSFAVNPETILILRIAQGLFTGTITASATLVAAGTPAARLSYALGILSSSTFIGLSVGPVLGGITAELIGYRAAFRAGASILFIGFILVFFLIRETTADAPRMTPASSKVKPGIPKEVGSGFALALFLLFFVRFCRSLPVPFLPLYVQEMRGTIEGASAITGAISAFTGIATALAGFTVARVGDRTNKLQLITRLLLGAALVSAPLFIMPTLWSFSAVLVIAAFLIGGVEPTLQSFLSEHTDPDRRGFVFGVLTTVGSLGWFFAPLVGSSVSIRFGLRYIFLVYAGALGIAFMITSITKGSIYRRLRGAAHTG